MNKKEVITLALLIAVLPPAWAVLSPHIGIEVGPTALITAGVYAANGNKWKDAHRIAAGFLAGEIWAYACAVIMTSTPFNADLTLFVTLAVFGFLAVVISQGLSRIFYMPSWLAGWAIGMLTMNLDNTTDPLSLAVQTGAAMLVGVYYAGALLDKIHRLINKGGA